MKRWNAPPAASRSIYELRPITVGMQTGIADPIPSSNTRPASQTHLKNVEARNTFPIQEMGLITTIQDEKAVST
jgi:hypothetical protein